MDTQVDADWQALHQRVALGETLTTAEKAACEAGCHALDDAEVLDGNLTQLRQLRAEVTRSEREQQDLRERAAELEARVAALEAQLDPQTRQLLGIGS